jgi:hypothetical protein
MNDYLPRVIDRDLDELIPQLPAISIEGPKGVGKTESAKRRANKIYELDDPTMFEIVRAEPKRILEGKSPILIDEWQKIPQTWDIIRRAVDNGASPGRFLLAGSATPPEGPTHSGAGRIVTLRMFPLSLSERQLESPTVSLEQVVAGSKPECRGESTLTLEDYTREIVESGFPGLRKYSGRGLSEQLKSYVNRIVDKDFEQMGKNIRKPHTLKRWMKAYAAATATTASYEKIRDAATSGQDDKPASDTTRPYREILEKLWIIEQQSAWMPGRNYFSQLTKSPKHHLTDPALAAVLLGVGSDALLNGEEPGPSLPRDGTLLGHLFESLVALSVRSYAQQAQVEMKHFRTKAGKREVDIVLERPDQKVVAFEVKLGRTVESKDVKHLLWLKEKMGDDLLDAGVIHTGPRAYRRKDGIAVIPAALLAP